jgi:hypothetical protein
MATKDEDMKPTSIKLLRKIRRLVVPTTRHPLSRWTT